MKQKVIAERYAAALFGLAHDLNKADEFGATLHSVCDGQFKSRFEAHLTAPCDQKERQTFHFHTAV